MTWKIDTIAYTATHDSGVVFLFTRRNSRVRPWHIKIDRQTLGTAPRNQLEGAAMLRKAAHAFSAALRTVHP